MSSIVLLPASFMMIFIGDSFVLLWNWVPEEPPTKLPLPPSLDYIHFMICKILGGFVLTISLLAVLYLASGILANFDPMLSFFRIIWRSVLVCVAFTSRFLNAILMAITVWGSVLTLFRPLGQAASSALVRIGFIPFLQIVAVSLSETMFAQRILRLCE
jgi:hypothetical protein